MRQVVSLVKDGQVQFALVDDGNGELIEFAQVLLPHPERFGIHEAALLGTNLIGAIGLDGKPIRRAHEPLPAELTAAQATVDAKRERRLARKRESNRRYAERRRTEAAAERKAPPAARKTRTIIRLAPEQVAARREQLAVWLRGHPRSTTRQILDGLSLHYGLLGSEASALAVLNADIKTLGDSVARQQEPVNGRATWVYSVSAP